MEELQYLFISRPPAVNMLAGRVSPCSTFYLNTSEGRMLFSFDTEVYVPFLQADL